MQPGLTWDESCEPLCLVPSVICPDFMVNRDDVNRSVHLFGSIRTIPRSPFCPLWFVIIYTCVISGLEGTRFATRHLFKPASVIF